MSDTAKPWAGRFNAPTDAFVEAFTASVGFDQRLYRQDIQGSIAHATMLARTGILTEDERDAIVAGLERIRDSIEAGLFDWSVPLEDVHMNVETALTADIGEAGKKLHTGRSRNDQVATDIRLFLREEIDAIRAGCERLELALLDLAEREAETIMPGFTHLQVAQPITFGHHMMAWVEMLERDRARSAAGEIDGVPSRSRSHFEHERSLERHGVREAPRDAPLIRVDVRGLRGAGPESIPVLLFGSPRDCLPAMRRGTAGREKCRQV